MKMANLKGSTFQKQIKDAVIRLNKFGTSRHNNNINGFTTRSRLTKARTLLNKFSSYLQEKGVQGGKLNEHLTRKNVREFAEREIFNKDYAPSTVREYMSAFSTTLEYLRQNNITIHENALKEARELYSDAKENFARDNFQTGRYIQDLDQKLENLYQKNFISGTIAEIQATLGFRISETHELVKNFENYYNPQTNTIENIIGKANHEYTQKEIPHHLVQNIQLIKEAGYTIQTENAYRQDLKDVGIDKSHDLRITFAKNYYDELKAKGHTEREALKQTSIQLNHNREEITRYYLARV